MSKSSYVTQERALVTFQELPAASAAWKWKRRAPLRFFSTQSSSFVLVSPLHGPQKLWYRKGWPASVYKYQSLQFLRQNSVTVCSHYITVLWFDNWDSTMKFFVVGIWYYRVVKWFLSKRRVWGCILWLETSRCRFVDIGVFLTEKNCRWIFTAPRITVAIIIIIILVKLLYLSKDANDAKYGGNTRFGGYCISLDKRDALFFLIV